MVSRLSSSPRRRSTKKKPSQSSKSGSRRKGLARKKKYIECYDFGYKKGRDLEIKERAKYIEIDIDTARELYEHLSHEYIDQTNTKIHELIKRISRNINVG